LAGVVFINLLWGIGIGFALSVLILLYKLNKFEIKTTQTGEKLDVEISGSLSFLVIPSMLNKLDQLPRGLTLELHFKVDHLDHATIEALEAWEQNYSKSGGRVIKTPLDKLWKELWENSRQKASEVSNLAIAAGSSHDPSAGKGL
jgi:carbonic anhydrase